jgi:DNA-binding NarL/FixJ family response regulator
MWEKEHPTAVVLDDQPLWLEAMGNLLNRLGMEVVGSATAGTDALEVIEEHRPGCVRPRCRCRGYGDERRGAGMHPQRPGSASRPQGCRLGSEANAQDVEAAFEAGAVVFCVKSARPDDLASAIRQAFDRSIYVALANRATTAAAPAPNSDAGADLTRRELEILQLVAEGFSNSQLAKMLWVTEQTVKFHLSNIYRKLDVANRTEASRWAQLNGLLSAESRRATTSTAAA